MSTAAPVRARPAPSMRLDPESYAWVAALQASGPGHEAAVARLHDLLLKAARFEVRRRRSQLPASGPDELEEIAQESATDALMSVLRRLDTYKGLSKFTTWAYKFALLETSVKVRRRAWRLKETTADAATWDVLADTLPGPAGSAQQRALMSAIGEGIDNALTPHQRRVLVALAIGEVPIDVLAEDLATTRGALYKALHDARHALRKHLGDRGFDLESDMAEGGLHA